MKKIAIISLALAGVALASCKNETENKKTDAPAAGQVQQQEEQLPLVGVQAAVVDEVIDDKTYSSTVEAWATNNIAPQSVGRIERLKVEIGDYVNKGQIVAQMDSLQLLQAELQYRNDQVEYKRLKALYDKGGISQSDFDSFKLSYGVHKSNYNNVLKNTILRSPISGVVSARNYDSGDMYSMSAPIYVVNQIVPVKLLIGVSETDYNRVKKGDKVSLTTDAFADRTFTGSISNIYPTIDARTHTFNVEVKVANNDRKLRPGMYSKVNLTFGKFRKVIVPDSAVIKQQGSGDRFVYIYNPETGTVSYTLVKVGKRLGDRYVIESGVKEGDLVVTEGILRIRDGVKVKVK